MFCHGLLWNQRSIHVTILLYFQCRRSVARMWRRKSLMELSKNKTIWNYFALISPKKTMNQHHTSPPTTNQLRVRTFIYYFLAAIRERSIKAARKGIIDHLFFKLYTSFSCDAQKLCKYNFENYMFFRRLANFSTFHSELKKVNLLLIFVNSAQCCKR